MRMGKHPSPPLVDPFRVHRVQFIIFQFVLDVDCGIIVDLFKARLSQLYGFYVHVNPNSSNIIKLSIFLFILLWDCSALFA